MASRPEILLHSNSSFNDCLLFLARALPYEQYTKVNAALVENHLDLDGETMLSWGITDMRSLGISHASAKQVLAQITKCKEAHDTENATTEQKNDDRGKNPSPVQDNEPIHKVATRRSKRGSDPHPNNSELSGPAVKQSRRSDPSGSAARPPPQDEAEPDADMDQDDDASELNVAAEIRLEQPDDGVHPRAGASWASSAREGMETILKMVPAQQLRHIVDAEVWDFERICMKRVKSGDGYERKQCTSLAMAPKITKMLFDGQLAGGVADEGGTIWEGIDEFLTKYVDIQYIEEYIEQHLKLRFATPPHISDTRALLWRLWSKPCAPRTPSVVPLGRITFPCESIGTELAQLWKEEVEDCRASGTNRPTISISRIAAALKVTNDEDGTNNAGGGTPHHQHHAGGGRAAPQVNIKEDPENFHNNTANDQHMNEADTKQNILRLYQHGRQLVIRAPRGNGDTDYPVLLYQLIDFGTHRANGVKMSCELDLTRSLLFVDIKVDMQGKGSTMISTAFTKINEDFDPSSADPAIANRQRLVQISLDQILPSMDHLSGDSSTSASLSSTMDTAHLEKLIGDWNDACDDLEGRGIPLELSPGNELDIKLFDKLMGGVEDMDHPLDPDIAAALVENNDGNGGGIALKLTAYQKRALSFMLGEERNPSGTARRLWIRIPLPPGAEGVECWASPSLFQLYITKSSIAGQHTLGTGGGGAGWQALEMGMGKTAVIIAGIFFNPPPAVWRAPRPWTPYTESDYMATVIENMPRGGTLIIVPAALIHQWKLEIEKTLDNPQEVTVLDWSSPKRLLDCNEIASYDVVITTPQIGIKSSTLPSIYWHRIVIDEAQLNCGSLMTKGVLYSKHRWIVTGTPCNAHPESLGASLEFLRLGKYDTAQKLLPPVLSTLLRAMMVRYTKNGTILGEKNLDLQGVIDQVMECTLNGTDAPHVRNVAENLETKLRSHLNAGKRRAGLTESVDEILENPAQMKALEENKFVNRKQMRSMVAKLRSFVAGGTEHTTGDVVYNQETDGYDRVKHRCTTKVELLVTRLLALMAADRETKVLVFSEYVDVLREVERRLTVKRVQYHSLLTSSSAKKRGEYIQSFMAPDSGVRIFLLSARAGGIGITLTAASHVFLMEPLMNKSLEQQAIGRVHRMGQTKPVTVTRMYLANTIEEKVRELVARRSGEREFVSTAGDAIGESAEVKCQLSDYYELVKYDDAVGNDGVDDDTGSNDNANANAAADHDDDDDDDHDENYFDREIHADWFGVDNRNRRRRGT